MTHVAKWTHLQTPHMCKHVNGYINVTSTRHAANVHISRVSMCESHLCMWLSSTRHATDSVAISYQQELLNNKKGAKWQFDKMGSAQKNPQNRMKLEKTFLWQSPMAPIGPKKDLILR